MGMLYSVQGARVPGSSYGVKGEFTAKLNYINIPIMLNLYAAKGLALKFGFQPAFNIVSDYEYTVQHVSVSGTTSSLGIDVNSFDFAIPVGLSYEYKNVVIDARYHIGLTKLVDNSDARNSVFQFTLGYKFEL